MWAMSSSGAARGRPVEIDPGRLERVAIGLFEQRGYDAVSAAEIAEEAGVSRRSLFRYFPTKADLVWGGLSEATDLLSLVLSKQSDPEDPRAAVRSALAVTADVLPDLPLTRRRMRLIATHPELIGSSTGQLREQSVIILSYLLDHEVDDLEARVLGDALAMSAFNGYLYWATHTDDARPRTSVERALEILLQS